MLAYGVEETKAHMVGLDGLDDLVDTRGCDLPFDLPR
jgi:hypothetical protein